MIVIAPETEEDAVATCGEPPKIRCQHFLEPEHVIVRYICSIGIGIDTAFQAWDRRQNSEYRPIGIRFKT